MAKDKDGDVKVLKGQEAEDKVLEYMIRMNRPFGAVDVAANLKGAIPKTAAQKVLVALAEKGKLTQKIYGKTTFFVANQSTIDAISSEMLESLESDCKNIEGDNKIRAAEVKTLTTELGKIKATPTDAELATRMAETNDLLREYHERLEVLQSGPALITEEELAQLGADWVKWRAEWIRRRKTFREIWDIIRDAMTPSEATDLADELGIEQDSASHVTLEQSSLCTLPSLKRKRD